ncbi:hypothetical protein V8C35DRAFT_298525 [Trichoderma chlorosporum]
MYSCISARTCSVPCCSIVCIDLRDCGKGASSHVPAVLVSFLFLFFALHLLFPLGAVLHNRPISVSPSLLFLRVWLPAAAALVGTPESPRKAHFHGHLKGGGRVSVPVHQFAHMISSFSHWPCPGYARALSLSPLRERNGPSKATHPPLRVKKSRGRN